MDVCIIPIVELAIIILLYIRWPRYGQAVWHCLKRYSTLRACDIDFHSKTRATLTSIVMRTSSRFGRMVYRYFEVISVFSVLLFVAFIVNLFLGLM
ncbi:MAG: hypothetical protein ACXAAK_11215, partial [Candidatus Thorarchaeota archaeon]